MHSPFYFHTQKGYEWRQKPGMTALWKIIGDDLPPFGETDTHRQILSQC
jgi:hypothetical protein